MDNTRTGAWTLLIVLTGMSMVWATPPQPPPKSEEAEKIILLVKELGAKKDAEGLLLALQAAQNLDRREQGWVVPPIIDALRGVGPAELKSDEIVDALATEADKGYTAAVILVTDIGTEHAKTIVTGFARNHPNRNTRRVSIARLGKFNDRETIGLLVRIAVSNKERDEFRRAALSGLSVAKLTEDDYRGLFKAPAESPESPLACLILGLPGERHDPTAIGALVEVLAGFSERLEEIETEEKLAPEIPARDGLEAREEPAPELMKQKEAILECFKRGMGALHVILVIASKRTEYELRFTNPLAVLKDGKEQFSYVRQQAESNPAERKRVLAYWAAWWAENRDGILKAPFPPYQPKPSIGPVYQMN